MARNIEPCTPNPDMPFRDKPWWCPKPIFCLYWAGYGMYVMPYDLMFYARKQYYDNVLQTKNNKDA